jgi:uncharacterized protein YkwD
MSLIRRLRLRLLAPALLTLFVLLVGVPLGSVSTATAAGPTLSVSPSSGAPGAGITVNGASFPRYRFVTLSWDGATSGMPTVFTRSDGTFRVGVAIPASATAGDHTLRAAAGASQASATIRVTTGASATATRTATPAATPVATKTPTAVPPTATRVPTVVPSATAAPSATATQVANESPVERVRTLVNQERAKQGLAPLAWHSALASAAQSYATTMASTNCFSHTCPPVTNFVTRVENAGYLSWRSLGENIAAGQQTPESVMQAWMNSSGHRANILSPNFKEIGVGRATGGSYGIYWVQEFGARS